ncbi:hypothetical protein LA080_007211 [Diaporthe eres]|nr:hypothetical protein LA080_007211 [Diaporthe eres]
MSLPNVTTSPERLLRLATSRSHLDLNTFYRGKGGRVIPSSEAFGHAVISDTAQADRNVLPAAEPPPSYNEDFPPASARKRPRNGEGSDNKPESLGAHGIFANAAEVIENLHASTAAAAAMDARLRATLREIETVQGCELGRQRRMSSVPRATSASPSPTASKGETASRASSVSEAISERLKAYLDERLEQFQQDARAFYDSRLDESLADHPTTEHMEQFVRTEFEEATVDFIEETRMWEAIQEAVDKVQDDMRRRMLDAWND